jgi:RND family efflux transporter MFP subunit
MRLGQNPLLAASTRHPHDNGPAMPATPSPGPVRAARANRARGAAAPPCAIRVRRVHGGVAALFAFALSSLSTGTQAQGSSAPPAAASAPSPAAAAAAVQVRRLGDIALRPLRDAPAVVLARNESKVAAEVAGRVLRWRRDVGEAVARGEVLAEIDGTDYRLARERAKASLAAAQARQQLAMTQLQRSRELVGQGFQSQEVVNQRETEVQALAAEIASARSQLATAEQQLARTRVVAPFAASVKQRFAQAGEYVAPGTPLYLLIERGGAEVSGAIAPADVASLRSARAWTFEGAGFAVPLQLARVAPTVSAPARTVEARFTLSAADAAVPGSEGRVSWRDERPHLSADWIVRRTVDGRSQLGVFVLDGQRARFVPLPAAQEGRAVAVNLPDATPVVVQGQAALSPGQAVSVAPGNGPAAAGPDAVPAAR